MAVVCEKLQKQIKFSEMYVQRIAGQQSSNENNVLCIVRKKKGQRSGIDTIKHHT